MANAEILEANSLRAFVQHGFNPVKISGRTQAIGQCPFCDKPDKFYVNIKVKKWDCKSCSKNGGFQTWLREIWEFSKTHFKGRIARDLVKDRGLDIITLKRAGIGYNPHKSAYILPIWDVQGERLHNLRIYKNKKLIGTADCNTGLYGWEQITPVKTSIWLCEGHWDALAMREALHKAGRDTELALAVPGANIFKAEWTGFLKDCNVNVLYDNDLAGKEGTIKVYNNLKGVCKKLNLIHWKTTDKEGKDIRDLWLETKKDKKKFFRKIVTSLKEDPQISKEIKSKINVAQKKDFKWKGKGLTAEAARAGFTKWLNLVNPYVIDIVSALFIGNRLDGDPLWLFLVGESGSGKSELIMAFDDVQNTTAISTLTTKTLISGATFAGGGDPSLIPRLDGRILSIKDLTTMLAMNPNEQNLIWGQLRDAYDGKAAKPFGNGTFRIYESKFGMLVGTTPIIEVHLEGQSAVGERFLRWNLPIIKGLRAEEKILETAMRNTTQETQMKKDLSNTAKAILDHDFKDVPEVPKDIQKKILYLAQFTSRLRGTVIRDKYSKEVTYMPFREVGTRLSKQLLKFLISIGMFRQLKVVGMDEYSLIKHIAMSTISRKMAYIVRNVYRKPDNIWNKNELGKVLKLEGITAERTAEDLRLLDVFTRQGKKYGEKSWKFRDDVKDLINKCEVFKK